MTQISNQSIVQIPLNQLIMSEKNVRKTATDVAELAENIAHHGLIQNLTAIQSEGQYEVIAGGRRLTALLLLAKQDRIALDHLVSVRIVSADEAHSVSLSENTAREQMHPADEFDAFKVMVDAGQSVEAVAVKYGITPNAVNRRLKLAKVAPSIMQEFREGNITIDRLYALATTDDHDIQLEVWENAGGDDADDIRDAILEHSQVVKGDHKFAKLVGLEAYEQAGGVAQSDLFGENENDFLFVNTSLLNKLAKEKMQSIADDLIASGKSAWVDWSVDTSYRDYQKYREVQLTLIGVPDEVKAQVAELEKQVDAVIEQRDALDEDEEDYDDDQWNELDAKADELHEQAINLELAYRQPSDLEKPFVGTFIGLTHRGELQFYHNLVRREDEHKIKNAWVSANAITEGAQVGDDEDSTPSHGRESNRVSTREEPEHSKSLVTTLTSHRSVALSATIAQNPDKALVITIARMIVSVIGMHNTQVDAVKLSAVNSVSTILRNEPSVESNLGMLALSDIQQKSSVFDSENLLEDLSKLNQAELLSVLAYLTAISIDTVSPFDSHNKSYREIGRFVGLDLNKWFIPTLENYWSKLGKQALVKRILEKDPSATGLDKKKRDELAQMASNLYEGSGYQPDFMQI